MSSRAWRKAQEYFKSIGEWFPNCVMHHIDMEMKTRDPERYNQWNPCDLMIVSKEEHNKIHFAGKTHTNYNHGGYKFSDETCKKLSDIRRGVPKSERAKQSYKKVAQERDYSTVTHTYTVNCYFNDEYVETLPTIDAWREKYNLTGLPTGKTLFGNRTK